MDETYAPVYSAIPAYADFHYSVLGEYTELGQAALGQMGDALERKLFDGFDQRFEALGQSLDTTFMTAYETALNQNIEQNMPEGMTLARLGKATKAVVDNTLKRAIFTFPIATTAAGVVGAGGVKLVVKTIAQKMARTIAIKASAKLGMKGGSILAGGGAGALACSWSGPGAAICGVIGGAAAWILADVAIVNIDEYFNRDEFEAELKTLVDEDRAAKRQLIEQALIEKAQAMDAANAELLEGFTLQELSNGN